MESSTFVYKQDDDSIFLFNEQRAPRKCEVVHGFSAYRD